MKTEIKNNIAIALAYLILLCLTLGFVVLNNNMKMLIAPMIGGLDSCLFQKEKLANDTPNFQYTKLCLQDEESASGLIDATLDRIAPEKFFVDKYRLGYTLYVPLLKLIEVKNSKYEVNQVALNRIADTIKNVDRPVILYLFSNHFKVGSPLEDVFSNDESNLLKTVNGPMAIDKYYGEKVYPWSFVSFDNEITKVREKAFAAVIDQVCKLPDYAIKKIEGVTLLGELHHMYPDFQGGMGFVNEYAISDYSYKSIADFRRFLVDKYKIISNLNKKLGSDYRSFADISPPAKNIRVEGLNNYGEHIDNYAHGVLPIAGWYVRSKNTKVEQDWIHIYLNGDYLAQVPVAFGRQDVLAAHPELGTSDVGWQYNLDYSSIKTGLHKIDIFVKRGDESLKLLGSRQIAIMDKSQSTPQEVVSSALPKFEKVDSSALFMVDSPESLSSYYFNPLVVLWHEFRKHQVSNYLAHFGAIARSRCIRPELIYSHQILPFVNPGWDETKFGIGRQLAVPSGMRLGVSLYGEASYGTSFYSWFRETGRSPYGITEFHPLRSMDASELDSVLSGHSKNNAQFLSFFIESVGLAEDPTSRPNIFSFDPNNNGSGSDILYKSLVEVLK